MSSMTGLPVELEGLLDDWFLHGGEHELAELLPPVSNAWTGSEDADSAWGRVIEDSSRPEMLSSPSAASSTPCEDETDATGSLPSSSGDDASEEKSKDRWLSFTGRKAAVQPARNASRERMKNELQYLRQRALELETQLAGLKSNSTTKQSDNQDNSVLRTVWQTIAERQLARRRQVESVNDRLKEMLVEYTALARRLEQFLYKRPRPEDLLCDDADTSILLKKSRMISSIDVDDEALLLRFVGDLEAEFELVDTILGPASAADATYTAAVTDSPFEPILQTKTAIDGRQVTYFELHGECIIPFPFERVRKAAWISAKRRYQRDEYVTYAVDHPDDTIAVRFSQQFQGRALDNIVVLRRYVFKDRLVWVWRTLSECGDECKDVLTDETGWCVFQPVPTSGPGPSSTTVMRSCIHAVPVQCTSHAPSELTPRVVSAVSAMLNGTYVNDEGAISSMVADLLLDDPLGF